MENSRPVHRMDERVYMDVNEVTMGQFKQFVEQSGYSYSNWNDVAKYLSSDAYPMVYVS